MRASSCLIGLVLLFVSVPVFAQLERRTALTPPARPVPVKAEYKHLRITKLPMDRGQVDAKIMLLGAVKASPAVLSNLSQPQAAQVANVINRVKLNDPLGARTAWKDFIVSTEADTAPIDLMEVLFYIFRESTLEMNEEIRTSLEKLSSMNTIAEALGNYLNDLRGVRGTCASPGRGSEAGGDADGQCDLKAIRVCIERERARAESQADSALQRRPHVISTVSNVSKILHDTAMSVIRKIG